MIQKQSLIQILKNNLKNRISSQIIEFVRHTNQKVLNCEDTLNYLKANIESTFKGKWQIAIGDCSAVFDKILFPYFIILHTRGKKYVIFSRGSESQKKEQADIINDLIQADRRLK